MRRQASALLALALSIAFPLSVAAQDGSGSIRGRVTTEAGQPLARAIVRIPGNGSPRAMVAVDSTGSYLISGLAPGEYLVVASILGYGTGEARVMVPAEGAAHADFRLPLAAIDDDFGFAVITRDPLAAADSALGAAVSVITPDTARAAVRTFSELLDARAAGLFVRASSGTVGAGSRVRLRGASSYFLPNYPLVVIDGVRTITDPRALRMNVGGQTPSSIDDLSPEEIASVRVLRGPAAAAAYGGAGAAGVLEVTTVSGAHGRPRWRAWGELGTREAPDGFPANFDQLGVTPEGAQAGRCTLRARAAGLCVPLDPILSFTPLTAHSPFRGGTRRAAGASVRGGLSFLDYAVSGEASRDLGVLAENDGRGSSFRGRFGVRPAHGVRVDVDLARSNRELRLPLEGNSTYDLLGAGLTGAAADNRQQGYRDGLGPRNDFYENGQRVHRTFAALQAEWRPWAWLRLGGRFGFDRRDADDSQSVDPVGPLPAPPTRRLAMTDRELRDGQLRATAAWRAGPLGGASTVEWQRLTDRAALDDSVTVPGFGGFRFIDHHLYRDHAVALRQALDWGDRLHAGAVVRRDAPGVGRAVTSASLGGSWDVGEEPFFPDWGWLDRLSLRAAYGSTGRTFATLPGIGSPTGDLCADAPCTGATEPERLREVEGGFDALIGGARIQLSVTGYRRVTSGLLIPVGIEEDGSLRLAGGGGVRNAGAEVSLRAAVLRGGAIDWDAEILGAANQNRITSIAGGSYLLTTGLDQYLVPGRPIGSYFTLPLVSATDRDGDGAITTAACPGPRCEVALGDTVTFTGSPEPTRMLAVASRVTLWGRVTLYARAEHQGGSSVLNFIHGARCVTYLRCIENYDASSPRAAQIALAAAQAGSRAGYVEENGFLKLREAAVTVSAPETWARRFGARDVAVTFAGRNLATRTGYSGLDPETSSFGQTPFITLDLAQMPLPRTWVTRVEVRF
jgi:TonB-dependent starch-binding outer membrane protein SusC